MFLAQWRIKMSGTSYFHLTSCKQRYRIGVMENDVDGSKTENWRKVFKNFQGWFIIPSSLLFSRDSFLANEILILNSTIDNL